MDRKYIEYMKEKYQKGMKVELISMNGEEQMTKGLNGTVSMVDDIGQIHVDWENGSTLALTKGDKFKKTDMENKIDMKMQF